MVLLPSDLVSCRRRLVSSHRLFLVTFSSTAHFVSSVMGTSRLYVLEWAVVSISSHVVQESSFPVSQLGTNARIILVSNTSSASTPCLGTLVRLILVSATLAGPDCIWDHVFLFHLQRRFTPRERGCRSPTPSASFPVLPRASPINCPFLGAIPFGRRQSA